MAISYQRKLGDGTIVIDSGTSNVGIGTNNPDQNLHINSSSASITGIAVTNTSTGASRLYLDASNGDLAGSDYMWIGQNNDLSGEIVMTQSAGAFHIKTQPGGTITSRLTVLQDGNVGIGTTNPTLSPTSYTSGLHVENNTYIQARLSSTSSSAGIEFLPSTGHTWEIQASNTADTSFLIYDRTSDAYRMTINESGYVGIGVGSNDPLSKLHVSDATDISMASGGDGQFRVEGNGYTGAIALDGTAMYLYHNSAARNLVLGTDETAAITIHKSNQSLDFNAYGAGSFKGNALYGLGVDSSGNVVETSGNWFGTSTGANTYTNQWHNFLELSYSTFASQTFKVHLRGHGNTSAQSLVGEIEFNFKDQSGTVRSRATVNSYGTTPIDKDDVAIFYDTTNGKINFYWKVKENYTAPQYYIEGYINNYIWKNTYIGDDTALALETNDSITSNLKFQGITQDNDSGYVGINQSAPGANFVVGGSSTFTVNTENTAYVRFGNLSSSADIATVESLGDVVIAMDSNNNSTGKKFAVRNNGIAGDELMTVLDTGNVGIGTTDPSHTLTVAGDGLRSYGTISSISNGALLGRYSGGTGIDSGELILATDAKTGWDEDVDEFGRIRFYSTDSSGIGARDAAVIKAVNGFGDGSTTTTFSGELAFFTSAYNANVAEAVRIDGDGNVGIGTTSPGAFSGTVFSSPILDLSGSFNIRGLSADGNSVLNMGGDTYRKAAIYTSIGTNSPYLAFATSASGSASSTVEAIRIDASQNVGIGTTSPDFKLEVEDTTSGIATIQVRNAEGTDGSGAGIRLYTTTDTYGNKPVYIKNIPDATGGALVINSRASDNSYSDTFYISGAGDVGIGTTSPDARLEVSSTAIVSDDARYELLITEDNTASAGRGGGLAFTRQGTIYGGIKTLQNTSSDDNTTMYFQTRGSGTVSNRMTIDESGNVQFNAYGAGFLQTDANGNITAGTVTTSDTLDDVTDNGNSTTNSITVGGVTSTSGGEMQGGDLYFANGGDDGAGTHIGNVWYSVSTSGSPAPVGVYESAVIATVNSGTHGRSDIVFKTKDNNTANFGSTSERMRILKDGRVGVNETNPLYGRFQVTQSANNDEAGIGVLSASAGRSMRLWVDETVSYISSGNNGAGILSLNPGGGNVGIGESNPASLLHLGKDTNGSNIISFGEASIGGPHGLDFYGDDATRTLKYSIYYRTGPENISMETSDGTKRFEITQSGAVTFNEAFTFPTADGSAGAALVTNGSGSLSWNAGYQQYTPVGWGILNNQTYTSTGANISSSSTQLQSGTTPVQRNSATEFEATKAGWYEISYSFIVKNNYANRAMIGAYMSVSTSGGGGIINGSHSTQYVRYNTYGEYAQIQNTFYYYTSYSSTLFYIYAYLLSGSMNMTTQAIAQSMISFRYINNDIT